MGDLIKYMLHVAWSVCKTLKEVSEPAILNKQQAGSATFVGERN